jgi:hypothetical protein
MLAQPFLERMKFNASILPRDYDVMTLDHDASLSESGFRKIQRRNPRGNTINRDCLRR